MEKLRLGVIGMSEGNGHPYSWSAIFNGYDEEAMKACEFPVISQYLSEQRFPSDFLCHLAEVTHIWTQDIELSNKIASAANIPNVSKEIVDMIGSVDAVLLARDDGENHLNMARPFLEEGLPIFIDKPFALNLEDAQQMIEIARDPLQIFTCSSLRFAEEFQRSKIQLRVNEIIELEARTPKYWNTYSTHILEPSFNLLSDWSEIESYHVAHEADQTSLIMLKRSGTRYKFTATGETPSNISILLKTKKEEQEFVFIDSFNAFKNSLKAFIKQVKTKELAIPKHQSLHIVECISLGLR